MKRKYGTLLACVLASSLAAGCAGGPDAQLSSCQQDKEQLLAAIRSQRDSNRAMHEQVASLEQRLDQAEKELARRTPTGTRLSSRPVETAPMPWRSPAGQVATKDAAARSSVKQSNGGGSSGRTGVVSVAALAQRHEQLEYDRQTGSAKVALDIPFEANAAQLTAEGRKQLDGLARLLKSDEAAGLRIMVAGHAAGRPASDGDPDTRFLSARQLAAARAQAVADYLDSHGIAEERLGVTGTGSRGLAGGDRLAGGVEIHLLPPDAPVVGWKAEGPLRR